MQTRKNKKQQHSTSTAIRSSDQAVQFKDNCPEATTQVKAQGMANKTVQRKVNQTGMSDNLKSGIENLSGIDMSDVKVHYNSSKPAQLQAHAYAQGNQIHLAPGQEKHLPHEAWHVVQQKQGRVQPTTQLKGNVNVNDNAGLEKEADVMSAKAMQSKTKENKSRVAAKSDIEQNPPKKYQPIQRVVTYTGPPPASKKSTWANFRLQETFQEVTAMLTRIPALAIPVGPALCRFPRHQMI